ncbi:MAG TPA: ion channel [Candidatus Kapabacteria bacterium]|nr:ion channel [Candidatus Kapabacteria bacterium]
MGPRATEQSREDLRDLGFGSRVSEETRLRLLNPDGSFNVSRVGLSFFESINAYHSLLNMSWLKFYGTVFLMYLAVNVVFAFCYMLCGADALKGMEPHGFLDTFLMYFFFSVQTFTTVGYGHMSPHSLAANMLVMVEIFIGLFAFALSTGLLFARFSRPSARILFSRNAIIAPYHGGRAFQFRIANMRKSQMIEVEVRLIASWLEDPRGRRSRQYRILELERNKVVFFPLHWTIVHNINSQSPLYTFTPEQMKERELEFLILITGVDDTFAQMVHARMSYRVEEVIWGAKWGDIFMAPKDNVVMVDLHRLHNYELVDLPDPVDEPVEQSAV